MSRITRTMAGLLTVALLVAGAMPAMADEAVDKAFEALKTYEWGSDRSLLKPIDEAVVATHGDKAARAKLEKRLAEALASDVPQAAKDYLCRQLSLVGTAECVPVVAGLLTDEKLSHMGRYALERIPCPEATKAMRDALGKVKGVQKVGVINSLGARRDAEATAALVALLSDSDAQIAAAAAGALGAIGTPDAANALGDFHGKAPEALKLAAADALLACAENLLADGKKLDALKIYKALAKSDIKHVKVAATRGMLAAAGKK